MKPYVVRDNDTWDTVAQSRSLPVTWLKMVNGMQPPTLTAGITIQIPDPPPQVSAAGGGTSNTIDAGPQGYVGIRMDPPEQTLVPLEEPDAKEDSSQPPPASPAPAGKLRGPSGFLQFIVTLAQPVQRTVIQVLEPGGTVLYEETHDDGPLVESAGNVPWKWDGYSDDQVLDTKVLRGRLIVAVLAWPPSGQGDLVAMCAFDGVPELGKYIDVTVDTKQNKVGATFYVTIESSNVFTTVGEAVAGTAVGAVLGAGVGLAAGLLGHKSGGEVAKETAIAGAIGAGVGLAAGLTVGLLTTNGGGATKASDADMARIIPEILGGIGEHWSRPAAGSTDAAGPPALTPLKIAGVDYEIATTAVTVDKDTVSKRGLDPVAYTLVVVSHENERACNLGMVVKGLPILLPIPPPGADARVLGELRDTAAHELGHSVLRDWKSKDYSVTHKGSTGGELSQGVLVGQPVRPLTPHEVDLMKYPWTGATQPERQEIANTDYSTWYAARGSTAAEDRDADYYVRSKAAQEDMRGLVNVARTNITQSKDKTATNGIEPHALPPYNDGVSPPAGTGVA